MVFSPSGFSPILSLPHPGPGRSSLASLAARDFAHTALTSLYSSPVFLDLASLPPLVSPSSLRFKAVHSKIH